MSPRHSSPACDAHFVRQRREDLECVARVFSIRHRRMIVIATLAAAAVRPALAQQPPPEPFIDREVCPFECCTYRTWTALAPIPVYGREAAAGHPVWTLERGEQFLAQGGNVHLSRVGVAVVVDTFSLLGLQDTIRPTHVDAGDSLFVLSFLGEGSYRIWYRGRVWISGELWPGEREDTAKWHSRYPTKLIREPIAHWWVRIRGRSGRSGWILMDDAPVDGADACG
jgi:hypothetical protein